MRPDEVGMFIDDAQLLTPMNRRALFRGDPRAVALEEARWQGLLKHRGFQSSWERALERVPASLSPGFTEEEILDSADVQEKPSTQQEPL